MPDTHVRLATETEIPAFALIDASTDQQFVDADHPELAGDGEYIPLDVAQRGIAESRIFVAEVEGEIVGWVFLRRSRDELCIGQIAVVPTFQQQGVGSTLVRRIIADAKNAGEQTVVLSTQSDLAWNKPWYETFGFRVVPPAEWTPEMRATATEQSAEGIDWANTRVHMRLNL